MKTAASMAALAALGLVAVNYQAQEGSQLFLSERITEEEMAFMRWVTEYGKSYGTKAEYEFRFEQFKKTLENIAAHTANEAHASTVGLNGFSDYTQSEWSKMLGYRAEMKKHFAKTPTVLPTTDIANDIDWRDRGAVTPVKN